MSTAYKEQFVKELIQPTMQWLGCYWWNAAWLKEERGGGVDVCIWTIHADITIRIDEELIVDRQWDIIIETIRQTWEAFIECHYQHRTMLHLEKCLHLETAPPRQ